MVKYDLSFLKKYKKFLCCLFSFFLLFIVSLTNPVKKFRREVCQSLPITCYDVLIPLTQQNTPAKLKHPRPIFSTSSPQSENFLSPTSPTGDKKMKMQI